ncbi:MULTISPECIES: Bug family tripartite tricarboxylate transporter substrate binding protein [Cupriavidus]|uniref:Tripartite tricarboxylate transporter substrate binding protein n=1 Tax=Cupriavidus pauculus TaxID=82633 RepID=A0A3G8H674_9BURK|nr:MULTISPECIES: tripartite tricarboxylate transporter substrate binding protein [Cupriavidus]AZG15829.1 tripartite tricarboxylate transporter substrate binding protein [Cupriavidus pauculus]MDT6963702.1 tripartite tricarboxylate transporter substrate binding protein [Cupriavidus sp. SZY C1]
MNRSSLPIAHAVVAGVLAAGASLACAQGFPTKPIQLVIPFPPGGATDVIGRLVGKKLGDKLGQPVVIDNRPGAGTIVGASFVAKAAPDGYTLLASSGTTFTVNPAIHAKLPYDPVKSFEPIGFAGRTGLILLANKDQPVSNLKQLVAAAKAQPGKYSYGSFGTGTTAQFAGEMLFNLAGVKLLHVPYKGSAPAMTDLIGGQIPFSVDTVAAAIPQVKSGKVKAIAVTTAKRSTLLPDVPTAAEAGYPGIDADTWLALVAPRGLPADVKQKLEKALAEVMADPDTRKQLTQAGFEPVEGNGAAVSALINKELPLMRATAQRASITAE